MTIKTRGGALLLAIAAGALLSVPAPAAARAHQRHAAVPNDSVVHVSDDTPAPEGLPSHVSLADWAKPCTDAKGNPLPKEQWDYCDHPREARPDTVSGDAPTPKYGEFIRKYPQLGEAGYRNIATGNKKLCDEGYNFLLGLRDLDTLFGKSDNEYQILYQIYQDLPAEVKRNTRIMQGSQVVEAGALCILSAGLYCIAAVANGVGNIATSEASLHLQLDNIRLSIANILVTRQNIWSNMLTVRLDSRWIPVFMPFCNGMGYAPIELPPMPPLPTVPEGFGGQSSDAHP